MVSGLFIACEQPQLSTVMGLPTTSDWIVSAQIPKISVWKKHVKGDTERADQLLTTRTTSECSVGLQEHVAHFLFRSAVCQVGWLPEHACILS